jgi:predicted nucleotidyltransferase
MTQSDPHKLARSEAVDFARRLAEIWRQALGTQLLGVYLIGSLAHAGFNRRYSDIDLAVVTAAGLSQGELDGLKSKAVALSRDWGPKVSIFWSDHAIALVERERLRPPRPTLDEIRQYLRGETFTTWVHRARSFGNAETLAPKDHKLYLRTILYPGRFCYSWLTGRIGSNAAAVAFLNERPVAGLDTELIARALQCRESAADPDVLFPVRASLPSQFDACAKLMTDRAGPAS